MSELLLELFSEEIPAKMLHPFAATFTKSICGYMAQKVESKFFYTPRRVIVHISGLKEEIGEATDEVRGPRLEAPAAALEGFMKKYSILDKSELLTKEGFYFHVLKHQSRSLTSMVKEAVELALNNTGWPKSMKWGKYDINWVRPLHSILCLLDNEVLPIEFGHLKASRMTLGHRFLSKKTITVTSTNIENFIHQLEENQVIIDQAKRQEMIRAKVDEVIKNKGLKLIEDQSLLDEITNLVEYPVIYLGQIDEKFMVLPEEVLMTTLRNNQRYLMLRQATSNKLAPYFIIVSNISGEDSGKEIVHGNQRVSSARLLDALFFYENDKKIRLEQRVEYLKKLTYHTEIGSVYEKIQSVKKLAVNLSDQLMVDKNKVARAAELMKTDLVTEMVGEFPELQGIMGYYYAINDNEDPEVAIAIKEHYKPVGPNDYVPTQKVAAIVALAEKLDTLNHMFAIDIKPTGSKDPYALRRAANGIVRIISENHFNLDIQNDLPKLAIRADVINYILERDVSEKK